MEEVRHVSFNLGVARLANTRRLLTRYSISEKDGLSFDAEFTGYCSLKLHADDPRLPLLADEIRGLGENPSIRGERLYTDAELDSFPWLVLRVKTVGLEGGANFDQPCDFSGGCGTCGAGAVLIPPLVANLNKMGKKQLDCTAHDGYIIVTRSLAEDIRDSGLTGFALREVRHYAKRESDSGYAWLSIVAQLPRMAPCSVVELEDVCPACSRAGHFDTHDRPTEFWYDHVPADMADFSVTWEYFGVWRAPFKKSRNVGGKRVVVVSQRARAFLVRKKVRHLAFEPVFFVEKRG